MDTLKEQVHAAQKEVTHAAGYVSEIANMIHRDHPAKPFLDNATDAVRDCERYVGIASEALERADAHVVTSAIMAGYRAYCTAMRAANEAARLVMKERQP